MTATQKLLVDRMKAGATLMWFGDNGTELQGFPHWPQKHTVRALIRQGVLKWGQPSNETQARCGIVPVVLAGGEVQ